MKQVSKQGWATLVALVVIAVSVSVGFEPLFELIGDGIASEFIASSFGAIFVIILTMFLLNKQTEVEQQSKRSERLFDEKVNIYQKIFDICSDMLMDGNLSQDEINRLPFPLIKLQMFSGEGVIVAFQDVFNELTRVYDVEGDVVAISENDKVEIYRLLSIFSTECRQDLEISDLSIDQEIQKNTVTAISDSNKKANDRTKYDFAGDSLPKNRYVYAVVKNYLTENPATTLEEFGEKVLPQNLDDRRGIYLTWRLYDDLKKLEADGKSGAQRYYIGEGSDVWQDKSYVLALADAEICISRSWGQSNMGPFLERMKGLGAKVS